MANIAGDFALSQLNGDMKITNGDFSIVFDPITTNQNIADILLAFPNEWQQYPNVGCSLPIYQNGQINGLSGVIRKQLLGDGINILSFNLSINQNSQLDVDITGTRQ